MDAPPRPAAAGRVRGIYAREDEAAAFLRRGIPTFATGDACSAWIRQHCASQQPLSNPERPHMQQLFTIALRKQHFYRVGLRSSRVSAIDLRKQPFWMYRIRWSHVFLIGLRTSQSTPPIP